MRLVTDGSCDEANSITARENAVNEGLDALNAMAVGGGASSTTLQAIVWPQPYNNLGEGPGFVVAVPTFEDFESAIAEKIAEEVAPRADDVAVPTLSEWAMILLALMLAGMAATRLGRARFD